MTGYIRPRRLSGGMARLLLKKAWTIIDDSRAETGALAFRLLLSYAKHSFWITPTISPHYVVLLLTSR